MNACSVMHFHSSKFARRVLLCFRWVTKQRKLLSNADSSFPFFFSRANDNEYERSRWRPHLQFAPSYIRAVFCISNGNVSSRSRSLAERDVVWTCDSRLSQTQPLFTRTTPRSVTGAWRCSAHAQRRARTGLCAGAAADGLSDACSTKKKGGKERKGRGNGKTKMYI